MVYAIFIKSCGVRKKNEGIVVFAFYEESDKEKVRINDKHISTTFE